MKVDGAGTGALEDLTKLSTLSLSPGAMDTVCVGNSKHNIDIAVDCIHVH